MKWLGNGSIFSTPWQWCRLLWPARTFEDIVQAYSGPGHFYHTLDHVLDVLATVDDLSAHAKNLNAVKLAAWLHDVIYDSKASDNEERSALYAERLRPSFEKPKRMMPGTMPTPRC